MPSQLLFPLSQHRSKRALLDAVSFMFEGGTTQTDRALALLTDGVFTPQGGDRPQVGGDRVQGGDRSQVGGDRVQGSDRPQVGGNRGQGGDRPQVVGRPRLCAPVTNIEGVARVGLQ